MDQSGSPRPTKKRRRVLSCNQCRRLKSRCEFDAAADSCLRCHKLRLRCSLGGRCGMSPGDHSPKAAEAPSSIPDRLSHVENTLESVKHSVEGIWQLLQNAQASAGTVAQNFPGPEVNARANNVQTEGRIAAAEFPPLPKPQSDVNRLAPILAVRKFRSGKRRLYKEPGRDVISQGILAEETAAVLVQQFIHRLGPVIQVRAEADLSSASSLREASPLLFAVCSLQALRFFRDSAMVTPLSHRQLYEEVRRMLGQVALETPVAIEELYAMLIMCTFEAAPRPVYEHIESWHLSGICAQQALTAIDFASIMTNLRNGRHHSDDTKRLALWNNICLVHLRFAVGTGKPATIPDRYLEQCTSVLNHPGATTDDGVVLAEILLLSHLHDPNSRIQMDRTGKCHEFREWEDRWGHLLASDGALHLRFGYAFANLVLAMRSGERSRSDGAGQTTAYHELSLQHALEMARVFLSMPTDLVQELPKFHHICIAYCCLVLSEYGNKGPSSPSSRHALDTLVSIIAHYRCFSEELPAVMDVARERLECALGDQRLVGRREQHGGGGAAGRNGYEADMDGSAAVGGSIGLDQGDGSAVFDTDLELGWFPAVDDFFDSWMMNGDFVI